MRFVPAVLLAAAFGIYTAESRAAVVIEDPTVVVDASPVSVVGGQTSVVLDADALSGAGLDLVGSTFDVINPGAIPGSLAFGINPRDAATRPTTMKYVPGAFADTVWGSLEHKGSLFFLDASMNVVRVGDFTIGFDSERAIGSASGFFVESNVGLQAKLFDVAGSNLSVDENPGTVLDIAGDLLVTLELAEVLGNPDLAGAGVGSFQINATAVPEVSTLAACGLVAFGGLLVHRRRRKSQVITA